ERQIAENAPAPVTGCGRVRLRAGLARQQDPPGEIARPIAAGFPDQRANRAESVKAPQCKRRLKPMSRLPKKAASLRNHTGHSPAAIASQQSSATKTFALITT